MNLEKYIYPLTFLVIIYGGVYSLTLPENIRLFLHYAFTVGFIFLSIRVMPAAVRTAIQSYLSGQDETGERLKQVRGIILILNVVLWIIGLIFLFDNLGFNVTAVLTGLGVGGIAIALAAQTILGDIFNYFVIFFDRPFEIGDFIIVGDVLGTVDYIGLKTTRIKSLQGEQIIFSNSNLTNSRIHNYKRMNERRVVFKLGVVYDTGTEKLEKIPKLVKSIINDQPQTRFDRAHFASFGEYSLNIEIVYFMLSADYNQYLDVQQKINLRIYDEFAALGIEFAFPTYSISAGQSSNKQTADAEGVEVLPGHKR
jgi:small-conductance mechanosensitive channel